MSSFVHRLLPSLVLLATIPVAAQSPPLPAIELVLERNLPLESILTSTALNLPAGLTAGVTSGALEVRERLIYNPSGATLTSTIFVVQPASPLPTPLNASLSGFVLGIYTLGIEKMFFTTAPRNSISFVGTVSGSSGGGVLGNVAGVPFTVSLAFTNEFPAKPVDLAHVIAGRVVLFSKDAAGTLVVPRPPAPPGPDLGPQIVINAPTNTVSKQISLDASQTTDASGTSLSFVWKTVNKSAILLNPNTAVATVQFSEGPGDYTFELTVTNGNGLSARKFVTVTYYGR